MTLAAALTSIDQTLLRHIYQLRLLTTSQARHITGEYERKVLRSLRRLAETGLVAEVVGPPPGRERRWLCTEQGRDAIEATREVSPRGY